MTSCAGSRINFNGERSEEGLVFCLDTRGELDELLGESGGPLPAANIEGMEFPPPGLPVPDIPDILMGLPAFPSSIKDFT